MIRLSCKGAILGLQKLGDQRLASYRDGHGHDIELWCTRRVFDSQFDLRVAMVASAGSAQGRQDPAAPTPMRTVGGCFFDNGDNQGPIIAGNPDGSYARVAWITQDPTHRRTYRFNYDFATRQVTITATVSGCAPVTKVVAPQPSYARMADALPHPESQACALGVPGGLNPTAPSP